MLLKARVNKLTLLKCKNIIINLPTDSHEITIPTACKKKKKLPSPNKIIKSLKIKLYEMAPSIYPWGTIEIVSPR